MQPDEMLQTAWEQPGALFILPFEELEPRWKVLRVDGMSPLDKEFDPQKYPLGVWFDLTAAGNQTGAEGVLLPATNRDPEKMTVVLMTGVTALVRATAAKMEAQGMTFPGKDILPWFQSADLRHISNEIAFSPDCPEPNPYQTSLIFCSQPEYVELLEYVGANVIELTGNHQIDWGHPAFDYTLNLYEELGMPYYAAGRNAEEARQPLLIEHNGNKIAFIGCNPSGPEMVWATELFGGVAQCDFEWMQAEIRRLRREGYLPIATMQYYEYYTPDPRPWQVEDFQGLAEAGAVIVSGSQAHKPQAFDFYGSHFIHYGVGNLFFDQMDIPVVGTRQEFLDRHVIYEGRHISTELLTAMLEDYARPRPMTLPERQSLLQEMFVESGWLPTQVP
jgi:poly-gamma-glutamate synthesis protein (capsule biosynthesis protein)